jgi:hypothetical protein
VVPPAVGERLSEASKEAITEMALGLLEEQVQARIVHYKADLSTNPELDAITAQVVAQLKEMQSRVAVVSDRPAADRGEIAASQERILKNLLARVFPEGAPSLMLEKRTKSVVRQLARLFFQSELHEKTRGQDGATKVIQHGEQAMFYLLMRYQHRMKNELEGFDYADGDIRERSFELLSKITKDMQDSFLSRRSSALKRLVSVFNAVLVDFYCVQMPKAVGALAHEVIAQSGSAEGRAFPYKVVSEAFAQFRIAFERRFMVRLVGFCEDELVRRLADTAGSDRDETLKFITDPHIFSMICGELCEAIYEYLCNEGFLDLPPDWRASADRPSVG